MKQTTRKCPTCEEKFSVKMGRGRPRQYCSVRCQVAHWRFQLPARPELSQLATPPNDPANFLPVQDMWHAIAPTLQVPLTFFSLAQSLRNSHPSQRNGLPMFQARVCGQTRWIWMARPDLFCSWLSHRKEFRRVEHHDGRVSLPMAPRDSRRRVLNPGWVIANTLPTRNTRRLTESLRSLDANETTEWRRPLITRTEI